MMAMMRVLEHTSRFLLDIGLCFTALQSKDLTNIEINQSVFQRQFNRLFQEVENILLEERLHKLNDYIHNIVMGSAPLNFDFRISEG
jgi:hypothetical protein